MMTKDQRQYVRYLRHGLGEAMRTARERASPLEQTLEEGYRWEEDETLTAMLASADLEEAARGAGTAIGKLIEETGGRLGKAEVSRLREARRFVAEAVKVLSAIDAAEMLRLEQKWLAGSAPVTHGHEVYFLQRFSAAMRILRLGWTSLFYATQKPVIRRLELSATEARQYYSDKPGLVEAIHGQADELAAKSGKHVEVYDTEDTLVYVASPGGAGAIHAGPKAAPRALRIKGLGPKQGEAIRELMLARPGLTLREAALAVGAELEPQAVANPSAANDQAMLREMWSWAI